MNKQSYVKQLKRENKEFYDIIELYKKIKSELEEKVAEYKEAIAEYEKQIEDNNNELDELEDNVWGNPHESQNDYMRDVLPPYEF